MQVKPLLISLITLGITTVSMAQTDTITTNLYFTTYKSPIQIWKSTNLFAPTMYTVASDSSNELGLTLTNSISQGQGLSIQNSVYVTDTNIPPIQTWCTISENLTLQYQPNVDSPTITNAIATSDNTDNCTVTSQIQGSAINIYVDVKAAD